MTLHLINFRKLATESLISETHLIANLLYLSLVLEFEASRHIQCFVYFFLDFDLLLCQMVRMYLKLGTYIECVIVFLHPFMSVD